MPAWIYGQAVWGSRTPAGGFLAPHWVDNPLLSRIPCGAGWGAQSRGDPAWVRREWDSTYSPWGSLLLSPCMDRQSLLLPAWLCKVKELLPLPIPSPAAAPMSSDQFQLGLMGQGLLGSKMPLNLAKIPFLGTGGNTEQQICVVGR